MLTKQGDWHLEKVGKDDRQVQRESTSENVKSNNPFGKHIGKFLGSKIYFNYATSNLTPRCLPKSENMCPYKYLSVYCSFIHGLKIGHNKSVQ